MPDQQPGGNAMAPARADTASHSLRSEAELQRSASPSSPNQSAAASSSAAVATSVGGIARLIRKDSFSEDPPNLPASPSAGIHTQKQAVPREEMRMVDCSLRTCATGWSQKQGSAMFLGAPNFHLSPGIGIENWARRRRDINEKLYRANTKHCGHRHVAEPSPQLLTIKRLKICDDLRTICEKRKPAVLALLARIPKPRMKSHHHSRLACGRVREASETVPRKGRMRRGRSPSSNSDPERVTPEQRRSRLMRELQFRDITPEDYDLLLSLDEAIKKKTLTQAEVDALPEVTLDMLLQEQNSGTSDTDDELICLICQDTLVDDASNVAAADSLSVAASTGTAAARSIKCLPLCGHRFHTECIAQWLTTNSTQCPTCRKGVIM